MAFFHLRKDNLCPVLLMALLSTLGSMNTHAQITPHSALKNFKLPKYNVEGYREYTLSGAEGIYDSTGKVSVKRANLIIYSGDEKQDLKSTITTDLANFDLNNDLASGTSRVEIKDPMFDLNGQGWTLDMAQKRITIEKEVTIRFYGSIDLKFEKIFE